MASAACEIVRRGAAHAGAQRLLYAPGVTSATTSTRGLCLTSAELPVGVRSSCHLHRGIESAGFVVAGTIGFWWGDELESHALLGPGDFAYIPADVPHVVANAGSDPATVVVAHGSADDQDGIELLPELDRLLRERAQQPESSRRLSRAAASRESSAAATASRGRPIG